LDVLLLLLFRRDLLPLLSDAVPPSLATLAALPARFRAGAGVREILVVARAIVEKSFSFPCWSDADFLNCGASICEQTAPDWGDSLR